jgi:lambda repressor-like predicted transcriptional regulator
VQLLKWMKKNKKSFRELAKEAKTSANTIQRLCDMPPKLVKIIANIEEITNGEVMLKDHVKLRELKEKNHVKKMDEEEQDDDESGG